MYNTAARSRLGRARGIAMVFVAVTMVATALPVAAEPGAPRAACETRNNNTHRKLLDCLTAEGVLEHLQAFQQIADANDGNRASGTAGYDASVEYVVQRLQAAGYEPIVQEFDFEFFAVLRQLFAIDGVEQPPFDFSTQTGVFDVMDYSGSGTVVDAPVVPTSDVVVPIGDNPANTSTSGCEPEDFAPAPDEGTVALVQRGTCSFLQKVLNAQEAGYDAVIVFNEGQPGRDGVVFGTLGVDAVDTVTIPAVGVSYDTGVDLLNDPDTVVTIDVDTTGGVRPTANVLAELPGTNDDNVVMLGAHLDSVPEGPGINDNGSGSGALLEVAEAMQNNKPENTVRFAWWGAEEFGLIGSTLYVNSLSEEELDRIALYLNFDMVASPNYMLGIYDGDESTFPAPVVVPPGSAEIEDVFQAFFDSRELPYVDTEFSGRSDYQAFINNGIAAGGLFTGAEQAKTEAEVALFGGIAGLPYDPCYHQACDVLDEPNAVPELEAAYGDDNLVGNVNLLALDANVDAIGYAALTFAYSTETVNAIAGKRMPGPPDHARAKGFNERSQD